MDRMNGLAKRIMIAIVGAGMGGLVGLLIGFLGLGNTGLFVGAIIGAIVPLVFLGQPGH
jgi:hypothetical protein